MFESAHFWRASFTLDLSATSLREIPYNKLNHMYCVRVCVSGACVGTAMVWCSRLYSRYGDVKLKVGTFTTSDFSMKTVGT